MMSQVANNNRRKATDHGMATDIYTSHTHVCTYSHLTHSCVHLFTPHTPMCAPIYTSHTHVYTLAAESSASSASRTLTPKTNPQNQKKSLCVSGHPGPRTGTAQGTAHRKAPHPQGTALRTRKELHSRGTAPAQHLRARHRARLYDQVHIHYT